MTSPTQTTADPVPDAPAQPLRTRTFEWLDPATIAVAGRTMAGVDFLRSLQSDRSAPIAECLGFRLTEVDAGRVVFEIRPAEFHYNPMGTVHGGVVATLCDSAMGAAVHSTLPLGSGYTSLEIKVNFVRAMTAATGPVRCEGKVVSQGSRVATAEARLTDAAGKLYAHASSTCLILAAPPAKA